MNLEDKRRVNALVQQIYESAYSYATTTHEAVEQFEVKKIISLSKELEAATAAAAARGNHESR